jgi:hypothetical protein
MRIDIDIVPAVAVPTGPRQWHPLGMHANVSMELYQFPFNSRALPLAHCAHGASLSERPTTGASQQEQAMTKTDYYDLLQLALDQA